MQIGPSLPPIRLRLAEEPPPPGSGAAPPRDRLDLNLRLAAGLVTAEAGDALWLRALVEGAAAPGQVIAGYGVALRQDPAAPPGQQARLLLRGQDVTARTDFTAAEFAELQVAAPAQGRRVDLAVAARGGTAGPGGALRNRTDSAVVEIGLEATGTRSLAAAAALVAAPLDEDAALVRLARDSRVFAPGPGGARPSLSTAGNLVALPGDRLRLSALVQATPPAGERIGAIRLALRQDPAAAPARLVLRGQDVTARESFSAADFAELELVAPGAGGRLEIALTASSGRPGANGAIRSRTDSAVLAITLEAGTARSLDAAGALLGAPTGAEAARLRLVRESRAFGPAAGGARPQLATAGNLAADPGDALRLAALFEAQAPPGERIGSYRLALRQDPATPAGQGARLLLRGQDVTERSVFTAADFAELRLVAPAQGRQADLAVVASSGAAGPNGTIRGRTDSQVVEVTVSATGTRSLNAAAALATQTLDDEAALVRLARDARAFAPPAGGARPGLSTVGNLSADAGDRLRLASLFEATAPAGQRLGAFRIALRQDPAAPEAGRARLLLGGQPVSPDRAFTPAEFAALQVEAPAQGRQVDIAVVASAGTPGPGGAIAGRVDSEAVQITLSATGTRSMPAAAALAAQPLDDEAGLVRLVREARVFGAGAARPLLATAGNLTADPGDRFRLAGLFAATAPAGERIGAWRIALRQDPAAPEDQRARLLLRGQPVSPDRVFTAADFAALQVVAPASGRRVEIAAVASSGAPAPGGGIRGRSDSAVVQVSLATTGTRSLNGAAALVGAPMDEEAAALRLVRDARQFGAAARPALASLAPAAAPPLPAGLPEGAFATTARATPAEEAPLLALAPDGPGGFRGGAAGAALAVLRLAGGEEPGGRRTSLPLPSVALAAYRSTRGR